MPYRSLTLAELRAEVVSIARGLSGEASIPIIIDGPILAEVYHNAMNSMKFHNLGVDGTNHYKEAAHFGYWLQKLKPLRFETATEKLEYVADLLSHIGEAVFFDRAKGRATIKESQSIFDLRKKSAAEKPLNELATLILINKLAFASHQKLIANHHPADQRPSLTAAIEEIHERFMWRPEKTARQLRYHSFTSRGFATMVEAIFKVKGLDDDNKEELADNKTQ
jgi:hypothetical protein